MIQTHIHLPKSSPLFKTLKKKKILKDVGDSLFIWLYYKPNIGELIEIGEYNVKNEDDAKSYLRHRKKPIIVRIIDLKQYFIPTPSGGITVLNLKVYEDKFNLDI